MATTYATMASTMKRKNDPSFTELAKMHKAFARSLVPVDSQSAQICDDDQW